MPVSVLIVILVVVWWAAAVTVAAPVAVGLEAAAALEASRWSEENLRLPRRRRIRVTPQIRPRPKLAVFSRPRKAAVETAEVAALGPEGSNAGVNAAWIAALRFRHRSWPNRSQSPSANITTSAKYHTAGEAVVACP